MLELLIGIPLTIAAWRRGWKGWALVPTIGAFVAQLVCGFMIGATASAETSMEDIEGMAVGVSLVIDLIAAAVLIGMIIKERKPKVTVNPAVGPMVGPVASIGGSQPARFCTNCGRELYDDASFCRSCGHVIERPSNGEMPLAGRPS